MNELDFDVLVERRPRRGRPFRLEARADSQGGITVICGASGSGKSTLLLSLLGAIRPKRGRIALGDRALFDSRRRLDLPIRARRVGMVFQDALLFPHLDVRRNVAFGLRDRSRPRRVGELLDRVGAEDLTDRRPSELSGGQRQRVALARALASDPAALLLDEPFSALDVAARESLQRLLLELQSETRIPFVHVTHDLSEALALGSHLVLLDRGAVVQAGPPAAVIARPGSMAAARAVGTENLLQGTVVRHCPDQGWSEVETDSTRVQTGLLRLPPGSGITLGLRAEDILISLREIRETSARNVLPGIVQDVVTRGTAVELRVTTPVSLRVIVTPAAVRELSLKPGRQVYVLIKANAFHHLA